MKGWMYILECSDGSYYVGSTNNLELRILQHQNGEGANYTSKRLPVNLVYFEEFQRIDEAFYREKQVQGWSRKKREALISGAFDTLPELSRNRQSVPSTGSGSGLNSVETSVPSIGSGTGKNSMQTSVPSTGSGTGKNSMQTSVPSTGSGSGLISMETSVVELVETTQNNIENRIFTIRGCQVMIDSHLSELYSVETKVLNQAVSRNIERFPLEFRFQLTNEEFENLRSQIVTSSDDNLLKHGGRRYLPYAFTEQGVAMLSAVLRSETAVKVSLQIMNAFVGMRKILNQYAGMFQRLDKIETKLLENDVKFEAVFNALEKSDLQPQKGIFFDGEVFDAWAFVSDLVRSANSSLVLIDNYVDDRVLSLFNKRKKGVSVTIYTKTIHKQLQTDLQKHNQQYAAITINELKTAHDRFLIIDHTQLYHIGASLKDLGNKMFAFSKMDQETANVLKLLKPNQ